MICWVPKPLGALPLWLWQPQHVQLGSQAQFGSYSIPGAVLGGPPTVLASPLCCNFIATESAASPMASPGLTQCQVSVSLQDPFSPAAFMWPKPASCAILTYDQVLLPAWDAALTPLDPQFLCAALEEDFTSINSGLLLINHSWFLSLSKLAPIVLVKQRFHSHWILMENFTQ